jgi:hypothetical protein
MLFGMGSRVTELISREVEVFYLPWVAFLAFIAGPMVFEFPLLLIVTPRVSAPLVPHISLSGLHNYFHYSFYAAFLSLDRDNKIFTLLLRSHDSCLCDLGY